MRYLINEIISFWKQNPIYPFTTGIFVYGILPNTVSNYFKSTYVVLIAIFVILLSSIVHLQINNKKRKNQWKKREKQFSKPFEKTYKGLILSISMLNDTYLFDWNKVPGDDEDLFIRHLNKDHGIDWVENAKITKSYANNVISVEARSHETIKIMIDSENGKGNLNIDNGKAIALKVKNDGNKLNIYTDAKTEIKKNIDEIKKNDTEDNWKKLYDIRGIGPAFKAIKCHIETLEVCWILYTDQSMEGRKLVEDFISEMSYTFKLNVVLIEKPFDIKYIYGIINEIYTNEIRNEGMLQTDVIADITGGTTLMSGAILIARTSDRDVQYLDQGIYELIDVKPV